MSEPNKRTAFILICVVSALVLLIASPLLAAWGTKQNTQPGTGIEGTSHDLAGYTGIDSAGASLSTPAAGGDPLTGPKANICRYCHWPHVEDTSLIGQGAPLWNHRITSFAYSTYQTVAGTSWPSFATGASTVSKLCLSCHDGTVAVDAYGSSTATGSVFMMDEEHVRIGPDLSNDHPVSVAYPGPGNDWNATPTLTKVANRLARMGNKVECAVCHDAHNTESVGAHFVVANYRTSTELCFACHKK